MANILSPSRPTDIVVLQPAFEGSFSITLVQALDFGCAGVFVAIMFERVWCFSTKLSEIFLLDSLLLTTQTPSSAFAI